MQAGRVLARNRQEASLGLAQFLEAPWLDHHSSLCFHPHADLPLWLSLFLL